MHAHAYGGHRSSARERQRERGRGGEREREAGVRHTLHTHAHTRTYTHRICACSHMHHAAIRMGSCTHVERVTACARPYLSPCLSPCVCVHHAGIYAWAAMRHTDTHGQPYMQPCMHHAAMRIMQAYAWAAANARRAGHCIQPWAYGRLHAYVRVSCAMHVCHVRVPCACACSHLHEPCGRVCMQPSA